MTRDFLASDMSNQYKGRMQKEEGRNDLRKRKIKRVSAQKKKPEGQISSFFLLPFALPHPA
jgi:hypothetical protein